MNRRPDGGIDVERLEIIVSGRVQGVGFRYRACEEAARLGLVGWARNRSDGSVQIVAEGERAALVQMADWAARGPARARVDGCETSWTTATGTLTAFGVAG
jgi:acylphosphatase